MTESTTTTNPYQPPAAELIADESPEELPTASLERRLAGFLIDAVLVTTVCLALLYLQLGGPVSPDRMESLRFGVRLARHWGWGLPVYLLLNGPTLLLRGQTLGKVLLRTRIVDHRFGRRAATWRLLLRIPLYWLIVSLPILSGYLETIYWLSVLRDDRRGLHDLLAGTRVVRLA